jgi:hypothetical protein
MPKPSTKRLLSTEDFRRFALSLDGAEESSHMGAADFRVGGRIFATLAAQAQGYGNLMLTPAMQADFVAEAPEIFLPVHGGWGRMGVTHIRLAAADEATLLGALRTAYRHRVETNARSRSKPAALRTARAGATAAASASAKQTPPKRTTEARPRASKKL